MNGTESVSAPSRMLCAAFITILALWIGGSVFFSALVLPTLFINMPPAEAGGVAALLFPLYFRAGLVCSLLAVVLAFVLGRGRGRLWQAAVATLAVMALTQAYTALLLHPEIASLRGNTEQAARFQTLHQRSVRLNAVTLIGGMALLLGSGILLMPRRDA